MQIEFPVSREELAQMAEADAQLLVDQLASDLMDQFRAFKAKLAEEQQLKTVPPEYDRLQVTLRAEASKLSAQQQARLLAILDESQARVDA